MQLLKHLEDGRWTGRNWKRNNSGALQFHRNSKGFGDAFMDATDQEKPLGPTGVVLTELPSPYTAHPGTGLLHLPRFIAKIRYTRDHGTLPKSYRKNYKRGFDRFLCAHLGVEPDAVEAAVLAASDEADLDRRFRELFPEDLQAYVWNRKLGQIGRSEEGRKFIAEALEKMGIPDRSKDIQCVADLIEIDEGRIPGYAPVGGPAAGYEPGKSS